MNKKIKSVSNYIDDNKKKDNLSLSINNELIDRDKLKDINIGNIIDIKSICKSIPESSSFILTIEIKSDTEECCKLLSKIMLICIRKKIGIDFSINQSSILQEINNNGIYIINIPLSFKLKNNFNSKDEIIKAYYYSKKTAKNIIKAIKKI